MAEKFHPLPPHVVDSAVRHHKNNTPHLAERILREFGFPSDVPIQRLTEDKDQKRLKRRALAGHMKAAEKYSRRLERIGPDTQRGQRFEMKAEAHTMAASILYNDFKRET